MKKSYLIISIISLVLGGISFLIAMLFTLIGSFICGKPFYMINGSNDSIPVCTSIMDTDFIWFLAIGIILLFIGILFLVLCRKKRHVRL